MSQHYSNCSCCIELIVHIGIDPIICLIQDYVHELSRKDWEYLVDGFESHKLATENGVFETNTRERFQEIQRTCLRIRVFRQNSWLSYITPQLLEVDVWMKETNGNVGNFHGSLTQENYHLKMTDAKWIQDKHPLDHIWNDFEQSQEATFHTDNVLFKIFRNLRGLINQELYEYRKAWGLFWCLHGIKAHSVTQKTTPLLGTKLEYPEYNIFYDKNGTPHLSILSSQFSQPKSLAPSKRRKKRRRFSFESSLQHEQPDGCLLSRNSST